MLTVIAFLLLQQHICADTMRSAAVLVAAAIAFFFDAVTPAAADSWGAIVVSITILVSLIPLIRGLVVTARQLVIESRNKPEFTSDTTTPASYLLASNPTETQPNNEQTTNAATKRARRACECSELDV